MQRTLLTTAALFEGLAGLVLVVAPGLAIAVLVGAEADRIGLMVGRITGAALLSLGVACWGARTDRGGAARTGTLRAIALYNLAAGLFLVVFAGTGQARGPVAWIAGGLHLGLGFAVAGSMLTPSDGDRRP